jgi:hypothetical protein
MKKGLEIVGAVTLTGVFAVWGAFVAKLVLLWDIYKYKFQVLELLSQPRRIRT